MCAAELQALGDEEGDQASRGEAIKWVGPRQLAGVKIMPGELTPDCRPPATIILKSRC